MLFVVVVVGVVVIYDLVVALVFELDWKKKKHRNNMTKKKMKNKKNKKKMEEDM